MFGNLAGRSAVIALTLGIGSIASILLASLLIELPDPGNVMGLLASIVLFGVGFTGLAIGISATVRNRGKAMAVAIGSLLAFLLVWGFDCT